MPNNDRDSIDTFLFGLWEFIIVFGGTLYATAVILVKSMTESLTYIIKMMFSEMKKSWKNGKR